jgi:hypothetical protein
MTDFLLAIAYNGKNFGFNDEIAFYEQMRYPSPIGNHNSICVFTNSFAPMIPFAPFSLSKTSVPSLPDANRRTLAQFVHYFFAEMKFPFTALSSANHHNQEIQQQND